MKRQMCVTLAMLMALSTLSGCSQTSEDLEAVQSLSRQPYRSLQRVLDTNAEGMKYSSFSQRTAVEDYQANYNKVSAEKQTKYIEFLSQILAEHNKNTDYNVDLVSQENHDYWKNLTDDMILENPRALQIKEYSGYYFLTAEFTTRPNKLGSFLATANYLGLDNCFKHDENAYPVLNDIWIAQAFPELNKEREALGKEPYRLFINSDSSMVYTQEKETEAPVEESIPEEIEPVEDGEVVDGAEDVVEDITTEETVVAETEPSIEDNSQEVYVAENQALGDSDIYNENLRKLEYDVIEYEEVFGSSQDGVSFMPYLSQVYQSVAPQGALTGDGCYNEGISGLREFNFNRDELVPYTYASADGSTTVDVSGVMTVTFIFKQNELDKDKVDYVFAYLEDYQSMNPFLTEGYGATNNYLAVPNFVDEQIRIKVEELDRLINNGDINGLMRMDVIEDAGLAIKLAQYRNTTDIVNYTTDVKGVLARKGNVFLVEVERTIAETPKNTGYVSQYKEKAYLVVRQKDLNFYINDIYTASRELTKQPQIEEISQTYRQLVSLNLSDTEIQNSIEEIKSTVLNDWIFYCNQKILGEDGIENYGMYEMFNDNRSVLSETDLEYINSKMQGLLFAQGYNYPGTLKIKPIEWIGGTEDQVEFTTEELITYGDSGIATKLTCYYLVSHFGNRWVIDDIQVIDEQLNISGQDYALAQENFSGEDVLKGETASNQAVTDVVVGGQ